MQSNPLLQPIARILQDLSGSISEYELIRQLDLQLCEVGDETSISADLKLFRHHFLVMNALYSLQPIFHQQELYLSISALAISLEPLCESQQHLPFQSSDHKLREYYLDWQVLEDSSDESVDQLLNSFWPRFLSQDRIMESLEILGLSPESNWAEVQKEYRKLASKAHPDKGGNPLHFLEIREAYETLSQHKSQFQ